MDGVAFLALLVAATGVILVSLAMRRKSAAPPASAEPPVPPPASLPVPPAASGCACVRGEKGALELLTGQEGSDSLWRCKQCKTPYYFNAASATARALTAEELARDLARFMNMKTKGKE